MPEKIDIRGVKFDSVSLDTAVDTLVSAAENGNQTAVFTPNSEIVQQCIEHNELYEIINSAELVVPDGVGVIKAGRILGTPFEHGKVAGIEVGEQLIARLADTDHTVLFVCLGAPAQEKWIYENRSRLPGIKVMLGLGGSLDGYSGNVKRAPKIFINLGLEWFYRLLKEPKRIGRMMKLPKFYFGTRQYKRRSKKSSGK